MTDRETLIAALRCDQRTLARWQKLPGAPKSLEVDEWREFVEAHGLGRDTTKTKTQLQEELLRRDIKLRDLKIARDEGKTVLVSEVREMLARMAAQHALLMRTKYDTELPARLMGKDIVAIRAEIVATSDEVCDVVNRGLTEWTPNY